jgi:hypothetical protein
MPWRSTAAGVAEPAGFATSQEIAAHAPAPFDAQIASKAARLERSGARGAREERDGNMGETSQREPKHAVETSLADAGVDVRVP